jgi:hypothetical protein
VCKAGGQHCHAGACVLVGWIFGYGRATRFAGDSDGDGVVVGRMDGGLFEDHLQNTTVFRIEDYYYYY